MANVLSIVSYRILPASLGGQKGIHLFNKYLSRFHKVICVSIRNNDAAKAEGYTMLPVLTNSKWRYLNVFYFFKFRKLIRKNKITHVILEHPYYGWLGILLKWFCGVKLIIHSHNIEAHRFKSLGNWWWRLIWFYEKWTHRLADETFNISPEDRDYMIRKFHLDPNRATVITYGIERSHAPGPEEKQEAKQRICLEHGINPDSILYFYNGTLDYLPNLNGVRAIIYEILPRFRSESDFHIIICGKDLPAEFNNLKDFRKDKIVYAGFVDDIDLYFKGTDIFINPVRDGAGIKTKLVEALGHDLNAVSTISGAFGIDPKICNGKLALSANTDWTAFTEEMLMAQEITSHSGEAFYNHFNWAKIAERAAAVISRSQAIT